MELKMNELMKRHYGHIGTLDIQRTLCYEFKQHENAVNLPLASALKILSEQIDVVCISQLHFLIAIISSSILIGTRQAVTNEIMIYSVALAGSPASPQHHRRLAGLPQPRPHRVAVVVTHLANPGSPRPRRAVTAPSRSVCVCVCTYREPSVWLRRCGWAGSRLSLPNWSWPTKHHAPGIRQSAHRLGAASSSSSCRKSLQLFEHLSLCHRYVMKSTPVFRGYLRPRAGGGARAPRWLRLLQGRTVLDSIIVFIE